MQQSLKEQKEINSFNEKFISVNFQFLAELL